MRKIFDFDYTMTYAPKSIRRIVTMASESTETNNFIIRNVNVFVRTICNRYASKIKHSDGFSMR